MKKKIFNGNQHIGYYDLNPRRHKRVSKIKSFFTIVSLYGLGAVVALGFMEIGGYVNPTIKVEARDVLVDNLGRKVDQLKEDVLTTVQKCESGEYNESDGLITFDPHKTNKKVQHASLGAFQFKVDTVQYYYKTLYNKDITPKEAILVALDDNKARDLAKDIIFKTKNGKSNWLICTDKKEVSRKLTVINELTK